MTRVTYSKWFAFYIYNKMAYFYLNDSCDVGKLGVELRFRSLCECLVSCLLIQLCGFLIQTCQCWRMDLHIGLNGPQALQQGGFLFQPGLLRQSHSCLLLHHLHPLLQLSFTLQKTAPLSHGPLQTTASHKRLLQYSAKLPWGFIRGDRNSPVAAHSGHEDIGPGILQALELGADHFLFIPTAVL